MVASYVTCTMLTFRYDKAILISVAGCKVDLDINIVIWGLFKSKSTDSLQVQYKCITLPCSKSCDLC